jgi:hypothetical protein
LRKNAYINCITLTNAYGGLYMLKLTKTRFEQLDTDYAKTTYTVDGTVTLAMDSIWGYAGSDTVRVTQIDVITEGRDDEEYAGVYVTHDADWRIYTDSGFEAAISEALDMDVAFTEQGMQEDNIASMEC